MMTARRMYTHISWIVIIAVVEECYEHIFMKEALYDKSFQTPSSLLYLGRLQAIDYLGGKVGKKILEKHFSRISPSKCLVLVLNY